jgi:hypothetical protein
MVRVLEHDLDLPTEQIIVRRPAPTIGHVDHIDAGHHLEQLARWPPVPVLPDAMLSLRGLARITRFASHEHRASHRLSHAWLACGHAAAVAGELAVGLSLC